MKASEARKLSIKSNTKVYQDIRSQIDKAIERIAKEGETSLQISFTDEHSTKKILQELRQDGYKCSATSNFDPRDGETTYVYSIRW